MAASVRISTRVCPDAGSGGNDIIKSKIVPIGFDLAGKGKGA